MRTALVLGYVLVTGCDGPPCVDGRCADESYTQPRPGPCESAHAEDSYRFHCTYSYAGANPSQIACTWETSDPTAHGTETATFSYDAAGAMTSSHAVQLEADGTVDQDVTWTFDPVHVTQTRLEPSYKIVETFDRATFSFLPTIIGERMWPRAELGLQSDEQIGPGDIDSITKFTWRRDGNTLTLTGGGLPATLELDDLGRLIASDQPHDAGFLPDDHTYTYGDAGQLIQETASSEASNAEPQPTVYHYDHGANLAAWTRPPVERSGGGIEVYDYSCW